jgi:hypothetical protein
MASTTTILNDASKRTANDDDAKKFGTRVFKKSSPNGKVSRFLDRRSKKTNRKRFNL